MLIKGMEEEEHTEFNTTDYTPQENQRLQGWVEVGIVRSPGLWSRGEVGEVISVFIYTDVNVFLSYFISFALQV